MTAIQNNTNKQPTAAKTEDSNVEPEVWLRTQDAKKSFFLTTRDLMSLPSRLEEPKEGEKKVGRRPALYSSHVLLEAAHIKHGKEEFEKMKQKQKAPRKRKVPATRKQAEASSKDTNAIKTLSATLLKQARDQLSFPTAPGQPTDWKVELAFCEKKYFTALMKGSGSKERVKEKDGILYKSLPATILFRCEQDDLKRKADQDGEKQEEEDVSVTSIIAESVMVRYEPSTMTLTLFGSTDYEFDL